MAGKLIVIDGTDGCGKKTQTDLLVERLRQEGHQVKVVEFPRYNQKSAGPVEDYLEGKYGELGEVTAKQASILYAIDRFASSREELTSWLNEGFIVVANRYVGSNMGHQGAKISDRQERQKLFSWLDELEYGILNIPRPDINLVLHVPAAVSQKLAQGRQENDWENKQRDIHEENLLHLQQAERVYIELTEMFDEFKLIECAPQGEILPREEISQLIWREVQDLI